MVNIALNCKVSKIFSRTSTMASTLVVLFSIIALSTATNNDSWDGVSAASYDSSDGESAASYHSLDRAPFHCVTSNLKRYQTFVIIARSIVQSEAWVHLELQQKSLFQEIASNFMRQFTGWELFSFLVHLDLKTQSLIDPLITCEAWFWVDGYCEKGRNMFMYFTSGQTHRRFARRARLALSNFIPIFFG